jgi:hypothetical protein
MRSRLSRARWLGLVSCCALVGVWALSVASAQAAVRHDYLSQITEVPAGAGVSLPGPVTSLSSMTVDSGHLWVAEHIENTNSSRVDMFDAASGVFVSQFPQPAGLVATQYGIAVGHGTGEGLVYVGAVDSGNGLEGRVAVFSEAGALLGSWTGADTPTGSFGINEGVRDVAVDGSVGGPASGDVYVVASTGVVDVFKPEAGGKEPLAENVSQLSGVCPVEGTSCEPLEVIPFGNPKHVAVDASTGDVLVQDEIDEEAEGEVVRRSVIDVFEPRLLGGYVFVRQIQLPLPNVVTPSSATRSRVTSLAVDGTSGEIYTGVTLEKLNHNINPEYAGYYTTSLTGFVDQFSSTGVVLGSITGEGTPGGDLRRPKSVAVDPGSHRVYVGDIRTGYNVGEGVLRGLEMVYESVPGEPPVIDVFGTDLVVPDVTTGPVSNLGPFSATLTGSVKLDKEGEATCRFVWGTTTDFGQPPVPCSAPVIEEESTVHADLGQANGSELAPDTTYFYRLQASNKNGLNPSDLSQDRQFTTPGPGIRGESVSNVAGTSATLDVGIDPNGAPTSYYFQYGTGSGYGTDVPVAPGIAVGSGVGVVDVSQHLQGLVAGTVYHFRAVAVSELEPGVFETFAGHDRSFITQAPGVFALPDGRSWEMVSPPDKHGAFIYPIGLEFAAVQASGGGSAMTFGTSAPTETEPQGYTNTVQVFSTRGSGGWSSRVITIPHIGATGASVGEGQEYRIFSSDLSLAVVQPFGSFNPSLSAEASEQTAFLRTNYLHGDVNVPCVSSCLRPLVTGRAGFANVPPGTVFGESNNENPDGSRTCPPILTCGPQLVAATPDLSRIFLEYIRGGLTSGSSGGIYEWAGGALTANGKPPGPRILTSVDGSYSYSVSGKSIFVSHAGSTKLVAELSAEDSKDIPNEKLEMLTLRVSPDGRWLTFMSQAELTGYDNHDAVSGKPDEEVYVYDASSGRLVCASCNPTGSRPVGVEENQLSQGFSPTGRQVWPENTWIASSIPGWRSGAEHGSLYQPRYLSDNGRLFFDSSDALVPQDVNGTQDVYQYEPVGVGDCSSASSTFSQGNGGCVGLISSGSSAEESGFMDASENGSDVFFLTTAKLSPRDYDTGIDIYDAHECMTTAPCFASQPVLPPPCTTGDACKPSPSPQPAVFGSPSSATFSGAGNVTPSVSGSVVGSKSLTRAQKLARALRACHKKRQGKHRGACERQATARYSTRRSVKANVKLGRG